jgi:hypothetical protein
VANLLARHLAELQHGGTPSALAESPSGKLPAEKPALAPSGRRRLWLPAAAVLLALLAGLALSEATGITNVRGTVIRLFSSEGASVVEGEQPALCAILNGEQLVITGAGVRGIGLKPGYELKETKEGQGTRLELVIWTTNGDLSPLKGMPITHLTCHRSKVSDLSPLKGMPLTFLDCNSTEVSDLTPLQGMPLRDLLCACPQVSDLSPLQGMRLDHLDCGGSRVTDLSPLQGMPLRDLHLFGATRVRDLSPLKGLPLEYLNVGRTTVTDLSALEDMTVLHTLILDSTPVADLSRLKGLPLKTLRIVNTKVSDLAPLKGMPLKQLWLDYQPKRDAEMLRSLKRLEQINDMPAADFWKAQEK